MSLKLLNTLTNQKEVFKPKDGKKVSLYVCGVTVYDYSHIGHARAYVVFDCVKRYLTYLGYDVTHIQNYTDIDDKIIQRSQEKNCDFKELTETFIQAYQEDMAALGVIPATHYPKATDYITEMIQMIQTLIDKGHAYETQDEVCFAIESFEAYGGLSNKVLDELEAGSRVEVDSKKKNPFDFVLWKKAKPGEPSWDSPWGAGRPGWHIECSAMVRKFLGDTIDIHGGGEDLVFPHHENEIAQSQCCTGSPLARYWLHNGFVTIRDEKMSKSKKNFFTIRDILKQFDGEVIRFFLLKVHYRSPLNFTSEGLEEAKTAYSRLTHTLQSVEEKSPNPENQTEFDTLKERFLHALNEDFNFAEAIGVLFDLNKLIHTTQSGTATLKELGEILGLFAEQKAIEIPEAVQELAEKRKEARAQKDFASSDQLRDQILELGYVVEDTKDGQRLFQKS